MSARRTRVTPDLLSPHPLLAPIMTMPEAIEAAQSALKVKSDTPHKPEHKEKLSALIEDHERLQEMLDPAQLVEDIIITANPKKQGHYLIVRGRHRWHRAKAANAELPCREVAPKEAESFIKTELFKSRQMTEDQKAWAAVLMHPRTGLKKAGRPKLSKIGTNKEEDAHDLSIRELAKLTCINKSAIARACRLFAIYEQSPSYRAKTEHKIWLGFSLDGLASGFEGENSSNGGGPTVAKKAQNYAARFSSLGLGVCRDWKNAKSDTERDAMADSLPLFLRSIPVEVLRCRAQELEEIIKEALKEEPLNKEASLNSIRKLVAEHGEGGES